MIEAEWWEYDSAEEMADAVAGDIGFIVESAIDARNEALLALAGRKHTAAYLCPAGRSSASLEAGDNRSWRRTACPDGQ
jgi:hypothetical protein